MSSLSFHNPPILLRTRNLYLDNTIYLSFTLLVLFSRNYYFFLHLNFFKDMLLSFPVFSCQRKLCLKPLLSWHFWFS
jgi:hypothetical protein